MEKTLFISHISAEAPVALVLQEYLRLAYHNEFRVFVSSDGQSIPGGSGWWEHIRASVRNASVVIALVSDSSISREWINFEAGVGDGAGARVIPVAIRGFTFDKLPYPLKGFQGRYLHDIEGILMDIDQKTMLTAYTIDKARFLEDIEVAEASVTEQRIAIRPILEIRGDDSLTFEVENTGNIDIQLISLEVWIPHKLKSSGPHVPHYPPSLWCENKEGLYLVTYTTTWSTFNSHVRPLPEILTRSMGVRQLKSFRFPLNPVDECDPCLTLEYQIHCRQFDTRREQSVLKDIRRSSG